MPPRKPDNPHPNAIIFSQSYYGTNWAVCQYSRNLPRWQELNDYRVPLDFFLEQVSLYGNSHWPSGYRQIFDDYESLEDAVYIEQLIFKERECPSCFETDDDGAVFAGDERLLTLSDDCDGDLCYRCSRRSRCPSCFESEYLCYGCLEHLGLNK